MSGPPRTVPRLSLSHSREPPRTIGVAVHASVLQLQRFLASHAPATSHSRGNRWTKPFAAKTTTKTDERRDEEGMLTVGGGAAAANPSLQACELTPGSPDFPTSNIQDCTCTVLQDVEAHQTWDQAVRGEQVLQAS